MLEVQILRRGNLLEQEFAVTCVNEHTYTLSAEEMEQFWFDLKNYECEECGDEGQECDPQEFLCECPFCAESIWTPLEEYGIAGHQCYGGVYMDGMHVVGTTSYFKHVLTDTLAFQKPELERRVDYWEGVVHFTDPASFIQILGEGVLRAKPTGYFGGRRRNSQIRALSKAVCFTETPLGMTEEICARFGSFGFCLPKNKVIELGGGPVLEVPEKLLKRQTRTGRGVQKQVSGWDPKLVPFVNKIGDGFSYTHEREWRVPSDVRLYEVQPWLVLPDSFVSEALHCGASPRDLVEWIGRFKRICESKVFTTHSGRG